MSGKILLIGTGALSTLFAARLSVSGVQVTMLGSWQNGIDALNAEGARLVGVDGITRSYSVRAESDPAKIRDIEHAIVLVKSWQTERVAARLAACLPATGVVLTLQNGLGNREILTNVLGAERVALGITTSGATLLGPGLARAGGEGIISIEDHPRVMPIVEKLQSAGFNLQLVEDAASLAWGKLVINTAINPLTALLRIPNGKLLERPGARVVMAALAEESAKVARAYGAHLPYADPVRAAEEVAQKTAANHSSMFQDVKRGAPTEIDAICGAVVRGGKQKGIPTPINWTMWNLVQAMAR